MFRNYFRSAAFILSFSREIDNAVILLMMILQYYLL
jgi:hypothetical protein